MTSEVSIKRLLQYRLCLMRLKRLGFSRVYSYTLGQEAGVNPEQVRKDFSYYGIRGNKKGGYAINELFFTLNQMFKRNVPKNVILIGIGNLGKALVNYKNFRRDGIHIAAAFDIDPVKINKKLDIPVFHINRLEEIVKEHGINTAIIAVPEMAAQEVCNILVGSGVRGILNFSPAILKTPENVVVNNVNLGNELEKLIYLTSEMEKQEI